jgi:bHLH-MYC and R2R3-MYB transcription factors N-terminal
MTQSRSIETGHSSSDWYPKLKQLVETVCATTVWEYGEVWLYQPAHHLLEISPIWGMRSHLQPHHELAWTQFQMCSHNFVLRPGEGLPGRVWQSRQPEWIVDTSAESETYFLRNQIAKACGVKAGFGVPVPIGANEYAVVVFFLSQARFADMDLMAQTHYAIASLDS